MKLADGERWVKPADFTGKAGDSWAGCAPVRRGGSRPSTQTETASSTFIWLQPWRGRRGCATSLLLNKGDGRFEDGSAAFGLASDRASIGVAAADFDADQHIDLFLTRRGGQSACCGTATASDSKTSRRF